MSNAQTKRVHLPIVKSNSPAPLDAKLDLAALLGDESDYGPITIPSPDGAEVRTSSYTIIVDLPDEPAHALLVHSYTGAYDRVTQQVASYVRSMDKRKRHRPLYGEWQDGVPADEMVATPRPETLKLLSKRGYLTQMTHEQEVSLFSRMVRKLHRRKLMQPPRFILMPTYQCNLRCGYCFQDHMRTDPAYHHLLRFMTREMVDRIILGMRNIDSTHGVEKQRETTRAITLFGGEPLLAESRPIIEYIMERSEALGEIRWNAVSNGTELDAYRDLLKPGKISKLQITLDGPAETHDQRRIYADGTGSFARIARNITMALEQHVTVSLRINVDLDNFCQLESLAAEFQSHGWTNFANFGADVAIVTGSTKSRNFKNSAQLHDSLKELRRRNPLVQIFDDQDDSIRNLAKSVIQKRADPFSNLSSAFCSAHTTMYVIDPFGDLYTCWERTGDPGMRIGTIQSDGTVMVQQQLLQAWRHRTAASNDICRQCRYASYCGGGCAVHAEDATGTMYSPNCNGIANRIRTTIASVYSSLRSGSSIRGQSVRLCDA